MSGMTTTADEGDDAAKRSAIQGGTDAFSAGGDVFINTYSTYVGAPDTAALRRLTENCTVLVLLDHPSGFRGSGFFVAPGLVITCAHNVAVDGSAASSATVEWRDQRFEGAVHAVPPSAGSSRLWDYPDLCLIQLHTAPHGHPWVELGDFPGLDDLEVYTTGYGTIYDDVPRLEGKSARLGGPLYIGGGRLWQFTGAELSRGNSGGPVVDLRSGSVCAISKATRGSNDQSGLVIPSSAIKEFFPDVWQGNQGELNELWERARRGMSDTARYPSPSNGSASTPPADPDQPAVPRPQSSTSSTLAGGVSSDWVDPVRGIPIERDRLDVGIWVSMLATNIASSDTQMPLSVGLFGEWGVGKSYFMGLLRSEIERLARTGREPYLGNISQIVFNAWHYTDTNLWASLGDEIFRQLAGGDGTGAELRQDLRDKIAVKSAERTALQARADHAADEVKRLQAQVDEAASSRRYRARELLDAMMKSKTFQEQLKKIWHRLGIDDEVQQAQLLATEVSEAAGHAIAVRGLLARQRSGLLVVVGVLAIAAFAAAAWAPAGLGRWLTGGGVAAIAAGLGAAVTWTSRARNALAQLQAISAEVSDNLTTAAPGQAAQALGDPVASLRQAEADEKIAQKQLDAAVAQVGQLTKELMDLRPSQRMYAFLAGLNQSDTYAGSLGLISTIRKDFEHLVTLLKDWQVETNKDPERRPINRIVLYIDDLDRCSAQQVVNVLQAVHLLLALDLFVVVVGVDPRWLQHSLEQKYDNAFPAHEIPGNIGHTMPVATPSDYLEKIFNVPFLLPGMPPGALGRMLLALSTTRGNESSRPSNQSADEARGEPVAGLAEEQQSLPAVQETPSSVPPQPTVVAPRPLTEPELHILSGLQPFIRTPRDAKRMLNLYRMLRSSPDLSPADAFLGDEARPGEYQAVAMLLAMQTSDAQLLNDAINARPRPEAEGTGGLVYRPDTADWPSFVQDFAPVESNGTWENRIIGTIPSAAVPAWRRYAAAATETSKLIALPDLVPFRRWAPHIQRFAFTLPTVGKST